MANIKKEPESQVVEPKAIVRTEITAAEFLECWEKNQNDSTKGCSILDEVFIFENIKVTDTLEIVGKNNLSNILVKNCAFGLVSIINSKIGDFKLLDSLSGNFIINKSITGKIILIASTIRNLIVIQSKCGNFSILNSSNINKFSIKENSKTGYLNIENCTIVELSLNKSTAADFSITKSKITYYSIDESKILNFYIYPNSSTAHIKILNSNIGPFNVSKSTINAFEIRKSKIEKFRLDYNSDTWKIIIYKNSIIGDIEIIESTVQYFEISDSLSKGNFISFHSQVDNFHIENSTLGNTEISLTQNSNILITQSKIYRINFKANCKNILITDKTYIQSFNWEQSTMVILNLENTAIESFNIKSNSIPKDSIFQIINCEINKLSLTSFLNTSYLNINNLNPLKNYMRFTEELYIGKYFDKSDTKNYLWSDIVNKSSIEFINSDLGKTSFVNCNLEAFDEFIFSNTKMLDVFVAGTKFPKTIAVPENINKKEQERLAYGQFKRIYENRGDSVSAGEFLGLELDAYFEQLKGEKGKWGEKINLKLNKFSSDHGNDWVRASLVTFLFMVIIFLLYSYMLGNVPGKNIKLFFNLVFRSFEFLNPIRKFEIDKTFLVRSNFYGSWWEVGARFFDVLGRIFISYFAYQTIQAFRRFGKKSV